MSKPTLLVLAAGMASRYGSLKQMEGIGPNNEAIIDYSIYDAIRAGFGKVVFVIRHSFEADFREVFTPARFGNRIEVDFVFQELDKLPEGYSVPEGRIKPWGTNHAVMMAAETINEPFAVINADDFYGADGYRAMADYLRSVEGKSNSYCMVAYELKNTLSDFGTVSRGVCTVDADDNLVSVVERTAIERTEGGVVYRDAEGAHGLDENVLVSMNLFGFTPDYFDYSGEEFCRFLDDNERTNGDAKLKSEFYMPSMVNKLINEGKVQMKVLKSSASWFGVTYKEDKPAVVAKLNQLIADGAYPVNLWGE